MMLFYKDIIRVRNTYGIFKTLNTAVMSSELGNGRAAITLDNHAGAKAMVITNPTGDAMTYNLNGEWNMVIDGVAAMGSPKACSGTITIPAYTAVVLLNGSALNG